MDNKLFSVEQIKNYLRGQPNFADACLNLSEKNIEEAQPKKTYTENWNPDWKGDPDDPARWKGW